jgi:hypothetical protein
MRAGGGDGSADGTRDTGAMDIEAFLRSVERQGFPDGAAGAGQRRRRARRDAGHHDAAGAALRGQARRGVAAACSTACCTTASPTRAGAARSGRGCSGGWSGATTTRHRIRWSSIADPAALDPGSIVASNETAEALMGCGGRAAAAPAAGVHAALLGRPVDRGNGQRDGLHRGQREDALFARRAHVEGKTRGASLMNSFEEDARATLRKPRRTRSTATTLDAPGRGPARGAGDTRGAVVAPARAGARRRGAGGGGRGGRADADAGATASAHACRRASWRKDPQFYEDLDFYMWLSESEMGNHG